MSSLSGFKHEHQRLDRDEYLSIYPRGYYGISYPGSQICEHKDFRDIRKNAQNDSPDVFIDYTDYDYCSIMHYPNSGKVSDRSSKGSCFPTVGDCWEHCALVAKKYQPCLIKGHLIDGLGQRLGLSEMDIRAINMRYGCKGYG